MFSKHLGRQWPTFEFFLKSINNWKREAVYIVYVDIS